MSTDVTTYQPVSFSQMERMAVAVAKSGLFGVKNAESALALMMLAEAEKIHPMSAVRDFHIINGRPAMKAEAMLARFHEAGGKVQWHTLDDAAAEATFSHRDGGEVKIRWDMARATKAGLAGKDIWKAYPRAMLRSRVVSEGIRTILPGVLAGKYSSEEAMHIETVEPISVEAFIAGAEKPGLPNEEAQRHMDIIAKSIGMETLKEGFGAAYKAAKAAGDEQRMESFRLAYEARKSEIAEAASAIVGTVVAKKAEGEQI